MTIDSVVRVDGANPQEALRRLAEVAREVERRIADPSCRPWLHGELAYDKKVCPRHGPVTVIVDNVGDLALAAGGLRPLRELILVDYRAVVGVEVTIVHQPTAFAATHPEDLELWLAGLPDDLRSLARWRLVELDPPIGSDLAAVR